MHQCILKKKNFDSTAQELSEATLLKLPSLHTFLFTSQLRGSRFSSRARTPLVLPTSLELKDILLQVVHFYYMLKVRYNYCSLSQVALAKSKCWRVPGRVAYYVVSEPEGGAAEFNGVTIFQHGVHVGPGCVGS